METDNKLYLWAERLDEEINKVRVVREPLIEHFMFRHSAHMLYAPDGCGKSLINLQKAMQATVTGAKVFGEFNVPFGIRVLYLQMERHEDEVLERLKGMRKQVSMDSKNFVLSTCLQGLNIKDREDFREAIKRVHTCVTDTFGRPDLIEIDPIYALVDTDLTSNKDVAPITNFSRILQQRYDCSINFVHHSNRGVRDKDTGKRGNEDMFGSRFLSAHFTGVYKLTLNEDESGTVLTAEKSSHKNLEKRIELVYDPESYLSWYKAGSSVSKNDKLMTFLMSCERSDRTFTTQDMAEVSGLSYGSIRNLLHDSLSGRLTAVGKAKYGKSLYKFKS